MNYALYVSGLGQETQPHPGFISLAPKITAAFGYTPVFCSYDDSLLDAVFNKTGQTAIPKIAIGHSLGAVKVTDLRDICPLVMLEPVRWPWYINSKPALTGSYKSLLIRNDSMFHFPPTVDAVGEDINSGIIIKNIVNMSHNEVVLSDDIHQSIINWMKIL